MTAMLRDYSAQVASNGSAYSPARVTDEQQMGYWLGSVARELRESHQRKAVHIAAAADVTESTISRFENAKNQGFPQQADKILTAYANDLEVDSVEIWEAALEAWRRTQKGLTVGPSDVKRLVEEAVQRSRQRRADSQGDSSAPQEGAL